jgi:hypothetical protein
LQVLGQFFLIHAPVKPQRIADKSAGGGVIALVGAMDGSGEQQLNEISSFVRVVVSYRPVRRWEIKGLVRGASRKING